MVHRSQTFVSSEPTSSAPPPTPEPPASRVLVRVLPVYEEEGKRTLRPVITVDADPNETIFDFKQRLGSLLTAASASDSPGLHLYVPSLFVVRHHLTDALNADTVSDLVMRRENYLHVNDAVSSCVGVMTTTTRSKSKATQVDLVALRDHGQHFVALGDGQLSDFIREDDYKMLHVIEELLNIGDTQEESVRVAVTGSPGVGKSEFLWFLFHQLSRTHTIVLDVLDLFLLVRPDGTMIKGDRKRGGFSRELYLPETIYLADKRDDKEDGLWRQAQCKVIVAVTPSRQWLRHFAKTSGRGTVLYMPLWSLSDLVECRRRRYHDRKDELTADDVVTLYEHFGCLPQEVVRVDQVDEEYNSIKGKIARLQLTLGYLKPDEVYELCFSAGKELIHRKLLDEEFCLELLHLKPSSDYKTATLAFASEFVRREVENRREKFVEKCWCCSHPIVEGSARYCPPTDSP